MSFRNEKNHFIGQNNFFRDEVQIFKNEKITFIELSIVF